MEQLARNRFINLLFTIRSKSDILEGSKVGFYPKYVFFHADKKTA